MQEANTSAEAEPTAATKQADGELHSRAADWNSGLTLVGGLSVAITEEVGNASSQS